MVISIKHKKNSGQTFFINSSPLTNKQKYETGPILQIVGMKNKKMKHKRAIPAPSIQINLNCESKGLFFFLIIALV